MAIGTTAAIIGASAVGGLASASAASKAADAQSKASKDQIALAKEQYDTTREDLAPFRSAGGLGMDAYLYELGLGAAPTIGGTAPQIEVINATGASPSYKPLNVDLPPAYQAIVDMMRGMDADRSGATGAGAQYKVGDKIFATLEEAQAWANANKVGGTTYGGYQESPDVTYAMKVGSDSVNALAGARGGLNSGATLQALQDTAMGTAMQGRNNYLNRLAGLGDLGMNAAGMNAQNSQSYVNTSSNALANMGNAQAAGAVGAANAISGGINNAISGYGYMKYLNGMGA